MTYAWRPSGRLVGRGAATNYQQDLANSDCILFMGSNIAEAHPVAFRWPMKAKEKRGRSSTTTRATPGVGPLRRARRHPRGERYRLPRRPVTYVLTTTAGSRNTSSTTPTPTLIVHEGFQDTEDLGGLFSGYRRNRETGY